MQHETVLQYREDILVPHPPSIQLNSCNSMGLADNCIWLSMRSLCYRPPALLSLLLMVQGRKAWLLLWLVMLTDKDQKRQSKIK